ncbi:Rpn family recombination-promoting nuclease/putative transposase [Treponema denticola]|uniref:Rpn family recombination-promoting nuclease/putative transposase n=1 Tax=Treponema denticola TaxID=158 RepID=A0A9Q9EXB2_TREDN|nr:Rpn family recombination-promoting nuclease/putative transposase [Treponema denticola]UTC89836.1 Rpn family recombination-promoting nuclease/putative transposase [Treponema denticola]UTD00813.1 Rpn family recombination-promoting nuclease/putative transposase [Treponema denticola]UTD05641.1 Rpn family recombination-promoting nuclease/putative transposase [Treponema denticola]
MKKSFDELTIADDFMFCKVMQDEGICKEFLEMVLADKIGKITYLSSQDAVFTGSESKSVRLDLLVKDETGKSYDIEMQVVNEHNIPKRMRYYQAAIDIAFLDKGTHYKALNDSYIIFVCLFDAIGKGKPLYTFENMCLEDRQTPLQDGTKKVIINAEAFGKAKDAELKGFLEYLKTGAAHTDFTGRIETMIQAVKHNEQARKEYRFMSGFEMDAREEGIQQGKSIGLAEGSRQAKLETARILKQLGDSVKKIMQATGLTQEEVESIS